MQFENNIEKFDFYSAKILGYLLYKFPVGSHIDTLEFINQVNPTRENDFYSRREEVQFVSESINTLKDFGFINFNEKYTGPSYDIVERFVGVRLTLKALEILKSMPESLIRR